LADLNRVSETAFADRGVSAFHGKHRENGALGRLLKHVQPGEVLLIEDCDRWSREDPLDALTRLREEVSLPAPVPPFKQAPNGEQTLGIDVSRVRVRLETLDSLMGKAKTDREWDNLARAYDRLFRVW